MPPRKHTKPLSPPGCKDVIDDAYALIDAETERAAAAERIAIAKTLELEIALQIGQQAAERFEELRRTLEADYQRLRDVLHVEVEARLAPMDAIRHILDGLNIPAGITEDERVAALRDRCKHAEKELAYWKHVTQTTPLRDPTPTPGTLRRVDGHTPPGGVK